MINRFFILFSFLLFCSVSLMAQTRVIEGRVLNSNNAPMAGVTVNLKGTKTNVVTDANGAYQITVPADQTVTLKISFVGYQSADIQVKGNKAADVALNQKVNTLDDVVVVGYGTSRKRDLTGSVEKINIKELAKAPVRSFDEALAGRAAGVQVVSSDGQPGAPVSIVIRGNNSITQDNSPLYVIDGFPVENFENNTINISDIESIEVLKDASATAIYGARAANGVIMITTKKGKAGKLDINYNAYYGINKLIKKMEVLSPYEFVRFQYEYDSINTKSTYLTGGRTIESYRDVQGIDWQDQIFRQSSVSSHELSLRGGNNFTTYSLSGSALMQDGIVKYSGYDRYQGRLRLDQKVNDKLSVGVNANYSALKSFGTIPSQLTNSTSSTSNLMYSVWGYRPVSGNPAIDLLDGIDPEFALDLNDSRFNPLESVKYEVRNRFSNVLTTNINFDYEIIKKLVLKSTFGVINNQSRTDEFNGSNTRAGSPFTSSGRVNGVNGSVLYNTRNNYVNENTLTYGFKLPKNHTFEVLGGMTFSTNQQNIYGMAATNLPNEELGLAGLDEGTPSKINAYKTRSNLVSFLGRANYNFNSKYLATLSWRADGSSRFSPDNKWSYFPSGSVAWRFSKESFMDKFGFVKDAKLRLSYGVTGNNRVSDYAYLSTMGTFPTLAYPFGGVLNPTIIPDDLGNKDLKWETTGQTDLGLDLNLFDDRINFTFDAYRKVTSNLLLYAQLPPSSGFSSAYKNVGKVENKGLEFTVTGKIIDRKDFNWSSSFNISFNRNKVLALNEGQDALLSLINWDNQWRSLAPYIAKVGQPLGLFYGVIWDGNYQYSDFNLSGSGVYTIKPTVTSNTSVYDPAIQPGHIKYRDLNGDRVINDDDMTIIGDANPDFIGGFSNNVSWKGFDLNLFFQFSYGGDLLNANRLVFEGNSGRTLQNQFATVLDRWTPDNQNNTMFVARGGGNRIYSSRVIEDGSYLRLKTVQLGYEIPKSLLRSAKVKMLRFYISAQNLLTWTRYTGVDPEVSVYNSALTPGFDYSVYPRAKTITFGVNLGL